MSGTRGHTLLRFIVPVLVTLLIIWSWGQSGSRIDGTSTMEAVLSKIIVSIRKSSSAPLKLTISVTNNHDRPLTLLTWNSPLDPSALQLGLLKFKQVGSGKLIEIPTIQVSRQMPPGRDSLITIEPRETKEQDIELKEPIIPLDQIKGDVEVSCHGRWMSLWKTKADEISQEFLEMVGTGHDAVSEDVELGSVTINF